MTTDGFDFDRRRPVEFPHHTYEDNERDVFIRHAVSRLPQMYRLVVELCDFECVSLNEAAREVGINTGSREEPPASSAAKTPPACCQTEVKGFDFCRISAPT